MSTAGVGERMHVIHSYGAFSELSQFLYPQEFLTLQSLNRFMYKVGISRVQKRWRLMVVDHYFYRGGQNTAIFNLSRYDAVRGISKLMKAQCPLVLMSQMIQVGRRVYAFSLVDN